MVILVREKKGTFKLDPKANTGIIYVPADITKDSGFPLRPRNVNIRIEDRCLIIESLPHFKYLNTYDDSVTIIDNRLDRQIEIDIRKDGTAHCDFCKKTSCIHTDYVLSLEEVIKTLKEHGWRQNK